MPESRPEQMAGRVARFEGLGSYGICRVPGPPVPEQLYVYDAEKNQIRPLGPEDLQPIDLAPAKPVSERIGIVADQIWKQLDALDALKAMVSINDASRATMLAVLTNHQGAGDRFFSRAAEAYANYIRDGAKGTLDMLLGAIKIAFEMAGWGNLAQRLTLDMVIAAVHPSQDVDFAALLAKAQHEKPELAGIIAALAEVVDLFRAVRQDPGAAFDAALDLLGEVMVLLLEFLRDAKIRDHLVASASDPEAIGQILGMAIGFVIWDIVIDELTTLGLGKATRAVRVLVQ
jgi:hypothetical protein